MIVHDGPPSEQYRGLEIEFSPQGGYDAAPYLVRATRLRFSTVEAARAHVDARLDRPAPAVTLSAWGGNRAAHRSGTLRAREVAHAAKGGA